MKRSQCEEFLEGYAQLCRKYGLAPIGSCGKLVLQSGSEAQLMERIAETRQDNEEWEQEREKEEAWAINDAISRSYQPKRPPQDLDEMLNRWR